MAIQQHLKAFVNLLRVRWRWREIPMAVILDSTTIDVIHPYANGHRPAGKALAALLGKTGWLAARTP